MTRTTSNDTSTASPSSAASSSSSRAGGPGPRGHGSLKHMGSSELPDALLIDLYDTLVWGEWPGLRDTMAARIGITSAALQSAFESTRPSRGVGSFAGGEEDMLSVLAACGVDPEPGLVAELLELERRALLTRVHLYEDSIPVLRALRARGVRAALVDDQSVYCDGAAALGMRTYLIQRDSSRGHGVSTDGHTLIPDLAALLA